jgi:DNA adenine methylase
LEVQEVMVVVRSFLSSETSKQVQGWSKSATSPFRYPGGKTKLIKDIYPHLLPYLELPGCFRDLFVGGGSMSIQVAKDFPTKDIYLNDLDTGVYAYWKCIELCTVEPLNEYLSIPLTMDRYLEVGSSSPALLHEQAGRAIILSRINFNGIRKVGVKPSKDFYGRWDPIETVGRNRNLLKLFKGRIHVSNLDVLQAIRETQPEDTLFLDPPYFLQGKNLYEVWMKPEEHEALAKNLRDFKRWIMTYDNHPEIHRLYEFACVTPYHVVNGGNHRKKTTWELLIGPSQDPKTPKTL